MPKPSALRMRRRVTPNSTRASPPNSCSTRTVCWRRRPDSDLADAGLAIVTAGINEKVGGATDRSDPPGRLRLLEANVKVYQDIVPRLVKAAPQAVLAVATGPPDPSVDAARQPAGHDRVMCTRTYLDSLRFRHHV